MCDAKMNDEVVRVENTDVILMSWEHDLNSTVHLPHVNREASGGGFAVEHQT